MRLAAIISTSLARFARDRFNLFFVFIFPLAIVLLIGIQFGDPPTPSLGVAAGDGPYADQVIDRLGEDTRVEVVLHADGDDLISAVDNEELDAGLVLDPDFDDRVEASQPSQVTFVTSTLGIGPQLQAMVEDALSRSLAEPTAVHAAVERGADREEAEQAAQGQAAIIELVTVEVTTAGERIFPEHVTGYDIGASSQLVLFVFLTSLTGSAAMIQSRRLGITTRMLSTPTTLGTIIAGEAVARFTIAALQGIYIMLATTVLFGVSWGNLLASAVVLAAFAAVGASAAMLSGSTFNNDEQAAGIAIILGLGLAALGGAMLPQELFSDTMLTTARAIPHYWAIDAFAEVIRNDGTVTDIGTQLGVLFGFAVGIGALAVWRLRATLTH